ncbi:MAG: hypothetical protein V2G42_05140 [bacterium JZ-2024 1]
MKSATALRAFTVFGLLFLGAVLQFEAPAVDILETSDGYNLSFPDGGTILLSHLQIQARQIAIRAKGKKVGEVRVENASFEGAVSVSFPEANRILAQKGIYGDSIFRLEGKVSCVIGEWKCEASRVVFLTDEGSLKLEEGQLIGQTLSVSARSVTFPISGSVSARGNVTFRAGGLTGEADSLNYDPETRQATLMAAHITETSLGVFLQGDEIHLVDNLKTVLVKGEISATLGGAGEG